jgi:hypothetical protein
MGRPAIGKHAMTAAERMRRHRKKMKSRRSRYLKKARGLYETREPRAVEALSTYLPPGSRFIEPCAASGRLRGHLIAHPNGYTCDRASDIVPLASDVERKDVFSYTSADVAPGAAFITNPPYDRDVLDPLIAHLSDVAPTWLLLYVGWLFAQESAPLCDRMRFIVPLGHRPRWFDGKGSETRDFAWVLFGQPDKEPAKFQWRPTLG